MTSCINWIFQQCRRPDSNRHGSPHHPLKMACLPSSTTSAVSAIIGKRHGFGNLLVEAPGFFAANIGPIVQVLFMFGCYYPAQALYFTHIIYEGAPLTAPYLGIDRSGIASRMSGAPFALRGIHRQGMPRRAFHQMIAYCC
jgi:hypothetical protein